MRIAQWRITRFQMAGVLIAALMLGPGAPPVYAGGVVGNGTPGSCTEAAFDAALAGGGTVTFNCGPEHTIYITSQKSINLNTTIDGGDDIKLDGLNATRLFDVGAVLTLRNITLARGYFNGDGGAIRNNSNGTLILENSTIGDSRATLSGGAILSTGPMTITNSLLEGNQALNGGALYPRFAGAQTMIVNSVLRDNHATDTTNGWGGAILVWDGAFVQIASSDIYSNTARFGGGIFSRGSNSVLALFGNTLLRDNRADSSGGGLYNEGTANVFDATLSGNSASAGGGLYNSLLIENYPAIARLNRVTLRGNSATGDGGGLYNSGQPYPAVTTLTNVTFSGNSANFEGGGLRNNGMATLTNVTLSSNSALFGGGLRNNGMATLTNVTLSGNSAPNGGGGLLNSGTATLTNATLSGNSSADDGGGLANGGTATLTNVTFSGNSAQLGGGLLSAGTATLTNVTLNGNIAGISGGGIYRSSGSVTVRNTIVANSPSGGNCGGSVTNSGFNLSSDTSCGFNHVPNVMLGPLAYNGGPTKTHLPLSGSPAIDFVTVGCPPPTTDQRGAARPVGAACDAGAVEYGAMLPQVYVPIVFK